MWISSIAVILSVIAFVPAGHMYGYTAGPEGVEVLEFRSVSKFNIEYKSQPPSAWAALAAIMAANRNQWKNEAPPERRSLRRSDSASTI
jgi:hypothetical protein